MKKLFSIASILLIAVALVGCEKEVDPPKDPIDQKDPTGQVEPVEDYEITFEFINEYGETTSKTVTYQEDYEGSFIELMILQLDVETADNGYGTEIVGIEGLHPKLGAYVALSKNGVMSPVGVDLVEYTDGDTFTLEVTWWDNTEEAVDTAIQLFLENYAATYVNGTAIDYNVLVALNLLGITNEYVSNTEIETIVSGMTLATTSDYFKAMMLLNVADVNIDTYLEDFKAVAAPGFYGQTAYGLLTFNSVESTVDYSEYEALAITDLLANTPYDQGLDSGAISLIALSNYTEETGVSELISAYSTWIDDDQLDSGGIKTRDMVWGETTYPGTENAATMSQVLLALIANDIHPNMIVSEEGISLMTRLLEFQTVTGSFDYVLDDEISEDLYFSTPQAFLALVAYQTYQNSNQAVNPYHFE